MAGQAQAGGGGHSNHSTYLWVLCGLAILVIALWYFCHTYIVSFMYVVKSFELSIVDLFFKPAKEIKQFIEFTPANTVTISQLAQLCNQVGYYIRIPLSISLVVMGLFIYFFQPISRFRKTYNMETLVDAEKVHWPQIAPVVEQQLVDENCETGEWAMALTPMQFAQKHNVLKITKEEAKDDKLTKEIGWKMTVDKGLAARLFSLQLGRPWTSVDALPPYAKALFAVFAAKAYRDRDAASKLLAQLAISSVTELDYTGVDELLAKHLNQHDVQTVYKSHAYESTVMIGMLLLARTDGVLASAEFLWLKTVDRKLWYILNTVGRQTAVPEVAGIYAHWKAERAMGKPLKVPMVQQAIKALEVAIAEVKYKPEKGKDAPV